MFLKTHRSHRLESAQITHKLLLHFLLSLLHFNQILLVNKFRMLHVRFSYSGAEKFNLDADK